LQAASTATETSVMTTEDRAAKDDRASFVRPLCRRRRGRRLEPCDKQSIKIFVVGSVLICQLLATNPLGKRSVCSARAGDEDVDEAASAGLPAG
jgi:hypothetical protein